MHEHEDRRRRVAVHVPQPARHLRQGAGRADAGAHVPLPPEIEPVSRRQLADIEHLPGARVRFEEQLVLFDTLGTRKEYVPLSKRGRGFGGKSVEDSTGSIAIATPGDGSLPSAGVAERAVIDRRCRGAVLIDVGLELLRAVDTAVARL